MQKPYPWGGARRLIDVQIPTIAREGVGGICIDRCIILLLLLLEAHGVLHLVYCLIENVALLYTIVL